MSVYLAQSLYLPQLATWLLAGLEGSAASLAGVCSAPPDPHACSRTPFAPHRLLPAAALRPCMLTRAPALPAQRFQVRFRGREQDRPRARRRSSRRPSASAGWQRWTSRRQVEQVGSSCSRFSPPRPLHVADALTLSDFERSMLLVDACCFGLG